MATITAAASGDWSNGATWVGGVKPGVGDTAEPAGFTVTIDENVNLGAGDLNCVGQAGYFLVSAGGLSIVCATIRAGTSTNGAVRFTAPAPATLEIYANVTAGSASNAHGVVNASTGTLSITGNVTGGTGGNSNSARNEAGGTLTITGNVYGGTGAVAHGARNEAGGTLTITGNVYGGSASYACGAVNASTGTLSITGNVTGGTGGNAHGARNEGGGSLTITGGVTGGSGSTSYGVVNSSSGSITITGNVTGGSGSTAHGALNYSQGILNITGNISGGPGTGLNAWGAVWANGGSGTIDGNVAATVYGGGVSVTATANNLAVVTIEHDVTTTDYRETDGVGAGFAGVKTEGKVRVIIKGSITDGAYGQPAVMGRFFRDAANPPLQWVDIPYWDIPTGTASYERLYHPAYIPGGLAEKDVRQGVGYFGTLVGTLAVPDPGSVALGVPVDDTVGTAVLTAAAAAAAVWDALRTDHALADTFGAVDEWAGGGGGSLDPEAVRAAVWDALTSELTADDSVGKLLIEKLALLVAGSVTISAPVLPNGNAKTIQGDDYLLEDGRALEWAISTTADLADAEIAVILGGLTTFEAELVGDNTVRLELTRTETAAIPVGNHDFALVATQEDGDVITLLEGRWRSTRRIVAP